MNRRNFLKASAAVALGSQAGCLSTAREDMSSELKFCLFADIHYYPGVYPHDDIEYLERVISRAKSEGADFLMHLGDFVHEPTKCQDYVDRYNNCGIPAYHVLGNHDCDGSTYEETLKSFNLEKGYYYFDLKGWRFVILDTNYCTLDGRYFHYSLANYPGHHLFWKTHKREDYIGRAMSDTRVSPEQLSWFAETIENSPYPCVVASHASFERANGSPDSIVVRKIINEANNRYPGRVRLVLNGHHHRDHVRILDNVVYMDVNSASYDWFLKEHERYPASYVSKWNNIKHCIFWDDPVSAMVSLYSSGRIKVTGQTSTFHMGISPRMVGHNSFDRAGRQTTPNIQSFDITLNY